MIDTIKDIENKLILNDWNSFTQSDKAVTITDSETGGVFTIKWILKCALTMIRIK